MVTLPAPWEQGTTRLPKKDVNQPSLEMEQVKNSHADWKDKFWGPTPPRDSPDGFQTEASPTSW